MTTLSEAADQVRAHLALDGVPASKKAVKNKLRAATQTRSLAAAVNLLAEHPELLRDTVWVPAKDPTGFEAAHRADHQIHGAAGAMPGDKLVVVS